MFTMLLNIESVASERLRMYLAHGDMNLVATRVDDVLAAELLLKRRAMGADRVDR